MKLRLVAILFLICLIPTLLSSQNIFTEVKLYFSNGETKIGLGKIPMGKYNSSFVFKENKNGKKINITHHQIDKVIFYNIGIRSNNGTTYRFIKIEGQQRPKLLAEKIKEQRVGLYYITYTEVKQNYSGRYMKPVTIHFLKKESDDKAILIKGLTKKSYKRKLIKYFADCPELAEKIRNGDFDFERKEVIHRASEFHNFLPRILDYYNTRCE